jgi:(1->4)-alpha-D-glucan 1-alpha-D-glucosylmutase
VAALRIPAATYRIQFGSRFRFDDARGIVPYLDALGVTDLYASPLFQARKESAHGYDVTDPTRLWQELGSEQEFDALVSALKDRDMGLLLDIVPNHTAASGENRWWMSVLANGAASPYAEFFDIDRTASKKALERKVLLPILGGPYGKILENGELSVRMEEGGFVVTYGNQKLPLSVKSWLRILAHRIESLEETYGRDSAVFREFWDVIASIEHLPDGTADPAAAAERLRKEEEIRKELRRLSEERPEIRSFLEKNLRTVNGRRGNPESFRHLDRLLSEQHYWLSFWRLANEEINYRRFFAISDLVGLRVEDFKVFNASHELVLRLVAEGKVTGLRVDHVDGLYDPLGYLSTLRDRIRGTAAAGPKTSPEFYIVVEKILQEGEDLPPEWPVCGTTGYDFLNAVNGVFVSAAGVRELDGIYARFLDGKMDFGKVVYGCKRLIMDTHFAGEMHALGRHLGDIADQDRYGRDLPRKELRQAIIETTASFPVYRTYLRSDDLSPRDRRTFGRVVRDARLRGKEATSTPVFDFLERVMMLERSPSLSVELREERLRFLMRWQQFTGPIMAKGVEDTALYLYNRFVSANEVGGNPDSPAVPPGEFHRRAEGALARWPYGMNATSTHDTKRSEDVRARINVISELPGEWGKHLALWSRRNEKKKRTVGGRRVPDRNEEILIYQTLLGAWPFESSEVPGFRERVGNYMVKAVREAKAFTRWDRPNTSHEDAVLSFVDAILEDTGANGFLEDFHPFRKEIAHYGALNSLSQVLLKIACPGVPDFYQGTELWDFSLVDPDNRRPVDFRKRALLLEELRDGEARGTTPPLHEIVSRWEDGRIKLLLTWKSLAFRRQHKDLFLSGSYFPLPVTGGKKEHVLAFAREHNGFWAVVAVPRLVTRLAAPGEFPVGEATWGADGTLRLPDASPDGWKNALTGEEFPASATEDGKLLPLSVVFRRFPVALLSGGPS